MSMQIADQSLSDQNKGLLLAVSSSIFIGASFIVKKKGLRAAGATGIRAGVTTVTHLVCLEMIVKPEATSAAAVVLQEAGATLICPNRYGGQA